MDDNQRPTLTVGAVADRLGITPYTVRRAVADGRLRAFKAGTWLRFSEAEVEAYRQRCEIN